MIARIFLIFIFTINLYAAKTNPIVILETSKGQVEVELYPDKAPKTVENFLKYVNKNFYNGTIFHRVIDGFMIQGGGFDTQLSKKKTEAPISNEAANGLTNEEGTIAMARTGEPDSATAQFFINVANNSFLNHKSSDKQGFGYAVFGRVKKGMPVVNSIKKVATKRNGPMEALPVENIIINKAYLKK